MSSLNAYEYYMLIRQLQSCPNTTYDVIDTLQKYIQVIYDAQRQKEYSKPMPWIGMYIVLASLVCILATVADLLHGLKSRKLWFPCKYVTLNAASLSVIAVAVKLPMDLNNSMPSEIDQAAKLSSMAFMCTMMVNSLPSLATMESKELLSNIIALGILVITLVVNVCIQISTGVVSDERLKGFLVLSEVFSYAYIDKNKAIASFYVATLLVLLIIYTCSALGILESKRILEAKYQEAYQVVSGNHKLERPERSTVEELKQHISKYWIMAGTGSPQFMTVCSVTTSASGVICTLSTILLSILMLFTIPVMDNYHSDYDWSVPVIFLTQSIGVILGTIAPFSRCFAALSFKVSRKWIRDHIKVLKVESYWTQKLCDWKQSSIAFQFRNRTFKSVIENSKFLFLCFCIRFQKTVVVACKMTALLPIFFSASVIVLLSKSEHQEQNKNLSQYVLRFEDDMEPAESTLKRILTSMDRTIKTAEKHQPKNLREFLEKSRKGIENFDSHRVSPLRSEDHLGCWSLELVTLTTIARSLPSIPENKFKSLLDSVSEGLEYVILVDECQYPAHKDVCIRKAAKFLWLEVEVHHKWLGNDVKHLASLVNTREILEWFKNKAESTYTEAESVGNKGSNESTFCRRNCAKSMSGIAQYILLSYQENNEEVSGERLFDRLSSMISDSLAACLTNLPQVIKMKCETNLIEKRVASVHAAAQLLGETTEIINILHKDHKFPCLSSDKRTSQASLSVEECVSGL